MSMEADGLGSSGAVKVGVGVGLALLLIEAAVYATVLRRRFVAPLNGLVAMWSDERASQT
jgi:hypothetical protein